MLQCLLVSQHNADALCTAGYAAFLLSCKLAALGITILCRLPVLRVLHHPVSTQTQQNLSAGVPPMYCRTCIACVLLCAAGKRFALGMCSLDGHQLAGEERFAVELHADGSVW